VEAKGDEVCSQPGSLAAVKPEASILIDAHATETMGSCCTSSSPVERNGKGKETSVIGDRSSKSPKFDLAGPHSAMEDNRGHVQSRISVDVSEKLVCASDVIDFQLENIRSADIEETELHSVKVADIEETNLPSLLNKEDSPAARLKSELVEEANLDVQLRKDEDQKASRFDNIDSCYDFCW